MSDEDLIRLAEEKLKENKTSEAFVPVLQRVQLTNASSFLDKNTYPDSNPTKVKDYIDHIYRPSLDPQNKVWGCHFHFDYKVTDTDKDSKNEVVIGLQSLFLDYLRSVDVKITRADCFNSGYGPHFDNNLEVRLEAFIREISKRPNEKTSRKNFSDLLLGILWGQINHFGHSLSVHPLTHDEYNEDLQTEGNEHDYGPVFVNGYPNWNLNFFYEPQMRLVDPNDKQTQLWVSLGLPVRDGKVLIDTRIPTQMEDKYVTEALQNFERNHKEDFLNKIRIPTALKLVAIYNTNVTTTRRLFEYVSSLDLHKNSTLDDDNSTVVIQGDRILNKTFVEDVGLVVGWLMVNRNRSETYLSFEVEEEKAKTVVGYSKMWDFSNNPY